MNITHSEMVARLMKPKADLQFTPEQCDMIHAILGISGECGELLDAVKKHVIYGKPLDRLNIIEELGDIEFYLQHLRAINGITREETIEDNMQKLALRYPGYNYTDSKAQERADKSDGWIDHDGSPECPVDHLSLVDIRFREEKLTWKPVRKYAGAWNWKHLGSVDDIVAYRLAK